MKDSDDLWEETPPDPAATIESLRSLGYTMGSAIADLVDNSIAAGATTVTVAAKWAPAQGSWLAVCDDGQGMTEEALRQAMRIGSADPLDSREERDLGRFGFGLKTASFSQARELIVATKREKSRSWVARSWDLDKVRSSGKWMLRKGIPADAEAVTSSLLQGPSGTVVVWRRLTTVTDVESEQVARSEFNRYLAEVALHLGMVFGRYIASRRLKLLVNRHVVKSWDPFLSHHPATQELPAESLRLGAHEIRVRPFVLPHETKLSPAEALVAGGPAGWNEQQGFYVYRKDRLITAGDWLALGLSRDDIHNLARIAVDVPAALDEDWQLDIRKAVVRPPAALRVDLSTVAKFTRRKAAAVQRHRGTPVTRRARSRVDQLWVQRVRHGNPRLSINRQHPLVAHLLSGAGLKRREITDLLGVLEQTIPVMLLPSEKTDERPLEDKTPEEIIRLADLAYDTLLESGYSRSEARQRLMNTEPFHLYPSLIESFGGNV